MSESSGLRMGATASKYISIFIFLSSFEPPVQVDFLRLGSYDTGIESVCQFVDFT